MVMLEKLSYIPPKMEKAGQGIEHLDVLLSNEILEQKETYFRLLKQAQELADAYVGDEDQYNTFFEILDSIEKITSNAFSQTTISPLQKEELVAQAWQRDSAGIPVITISLLMDQAQESVRKHVVSRLSNPQIGQVISEHWKMESETSSSFALEHIDCILLPPEGTRNNVGDGQGEWSDPLFEERLPELFGLLREHNIFSDDCIVTFGKVDKKNMRKVSYAHVEIPKINRTVLLCNQIGEATFVIRGFLSPQTISQYTKDQLQSTFPEIIERVVYANTEFWSARLVDLLTTESAWDSEANKDDSDARVSEVKHSKVDVHSIVYWRKKILEKYTPQEWVGMYTTIDALIAREVGIGLKKLGSLFGLNFTHNYTKKEYLLLGQKIFGNDPTILEAVNFNEKTPEQWRKLVRDTFSIQDWLDNYDTLMRGGLRSKIGIGVYALARTLGMSDDIADKASFLRLTQNIFGSDPAVLRAIDLVERTADVWSEIVKKHYSLEGWLNGYSAVADNVRDQIGLGLNGLYDVFGIVPVEQSVKMRFLRLTQRIFGDDPSIMRAISLEENLICVRTRDLDKIRKLITYSVDDWVDQCTRISKHITQELGFSLSELAKAFVVEGNCTKYGLPYFRLGQKIFGDNPRILAAIEIEERSPEQWIISVRQLFTPKEWVVNPVKTKKDIAQKLRIGIRYLATKIGFSGDPKSHILDYLLFGQCIFGDDPHILEAIKKVKKL